MAHPHENSDKQWREKLTAPQYEVCRLGGTEPPFSGELNDNKEEGTYTCVCCGALLFDSHAKYDSGSGWPSFWEPQDETTLDYHADTRLWEERTEVRCHNCGSHLGHVFEDGPAPTFKRYCINSVALHFEPRQRKEPH